MERLFADEDVRLIDLYRLGLLLSENGQYHDGLDDLVE
jgi:hypothetical protein